MLLVLYQPCWCVVPVLPRWTWDSVWGRDSFAWPHLSQMECSSRATLCGKSPAERPFLMAFFSQNEVSVIFFFFFWVFLFEIGEWVFQVLFFQSFMPALDFGRPFFKYPPSLDMVEFKIISEEDWRNNSCKLSSQTVQMHGCHMPIFAVFAPFFLVLCDIQRLNQQPLSFLSWRFTSKIRVTPHIMKKRIVFLFFAPPVVCFLDGDGSILYQTGCQFSRVGCALSVLHIALLVGQFNACICFSRG